MLFVLQGQNSLVKFHGIAVEQGNLKPVADLDVTLICFDSLEFKVRTDSSGRYSFFVSKKLISAKTKLQSSYDIWEYRKIKERDTTCRFINNFWGYMNNPCYFIHDSIKNSEVRCDFIMKPVIACPRAPTIYFEKNSTNMPVDMKEDSSWRHPGQRLKYMKCVMLNNPGMILVIEGNSSADEKDPLELSATRATFIQEYFVTHGIDRKRLVIKPFGCARPFVTDAQIKKAKTPADRDALLELNRYVSFRVVSIDDGR